jgi:xylitol oxidase
VSADDITMSPAKTGSHVGIHFTWFRKHNEIVAVLPTIEKLLEKFTIRPHVGKIFSLSGPKMDDLYSYDLQNLRRLMKLHDPQGKFRNAFIDRYIMYKDTQRPKL